MIHRRDWKSGRAAGAIAIRPVAAIAGTIFLATLASCAVGPDYRRPEVATGEAYQGGALPDARAPTVTATWWQHFGDPTLVRLEESAMENSNDLKASMARVQEARAGLRSSESQYYPAVTADPSWTRSRVSGNRPSTGGFQATAATITDVRAPLDLSYEVDLWGRVRRSVEAANAQARASADDFVVVRNAIAADVAQDWFTTRALDEQDRVLVETIASFRRQLELTGAQRKAGLATQVDVMQAEAQLESTLAQEIDVRRQRDDLQHALAILVGAAPGALWLPESPLDQNLPAIPVGVPSEVLQHRPDVAEAEENLIAASAQIGVAKAQFYPRLLLTGVGGWESADIQHIVDWPSRIWSIGPSITFPLFLGGQLEANEDEAKARYEELEADYRGAVLSAIRDVEDALTDLHRRTEEGIVQAKAVQAAREALRLSALSYEHGVVAYLLVIDAERTLLTAELADAQIREARFLATVRLVKAIGGGWDTAAPILPPAAPPTASAR